MGFREFCYASLDELVKDSEQMGLALYFSKNTDVLKKKVKVGFHTLPNSLAFHPMEGCDGNPDGSPGRLTLRRYERFSKGGAGLLWFEAVAVIPEGRAYPGQLWINNSNVDSFRQLLKNYIKNAQEKFGNDFLPLCIMQLTHSGRFCKPQGKPAPVIVCLNPYINSVFNHEHLAHLIEDHELEELEQKFVEAAVLAQKAGFHGVDVKACHRYLNSELLSAFTRVGKYGETFEGRTRFLLNIVDKIKERLGDEFIVTTRLNIYDGIPYPYGWGVDKDEHTKYDLTEPLKLIGELAKRGVKLINLTMGTPYYNPHVNRPYDKGSYVPNEHPLEGVARLINGVGEVQKKFPGLVVVGTGYSWLRHFSPYLAAGSLENGMAMVIGYGREAFAYPDFAEDIMRNGAFKKEKCCIACGKCTEIMRAGGQAGCVIRDSAIYGTIYKEKVAAKSSV